MVPSKDPDAKSVDIMKSYWRDISHCEPLSREAEAELFKKARAGDEEALHKIIVANLRFVASVARQYTVYGLPFIELISEGNVGLIEAARRFDETRGLKFITYAVWWIRQAILKALAQSSKAARPPISRISDLKKVEKQTGALSQELGRDPTLEEVAESMEISLERTCNALEVSRLDTSFDAPIHPDMEEDLVASFVTDAIDVEEEFEKAALEEAMRECLSILDEREHQIVCSYFGLEDEVPMTLEAIGHVLGVTRERVRQLRDRALGKMRSECSDLLMEFSKN